MVKPTQGSANAGKARRELRHVEVPIAGQHRSMFFEVDAKDAIRAAKRAARKAGFGGLDFDWRNGIVKNGPILKGNAPELEPFEEDVFRGLISGEIETEVLVGD